MLICSSCDEISSYLEYSEETKKCIYGADVGRDNCFINSVAMELSIIMHTLYDMIMSMQQYVMHETQQKSDEPDNWGLKMLPHYL